MKKKQLLVLAILCILSMVGTAVFSMGGEETAASAPAPAPAPASAPASEPASAPTPSCKPDQIFDAQTGTVECESIEAFKPESSTWWGTWINHSVPISSTEAEAAGMSHTFHELSSTPTKKKYIAMRKTDQHCKMVQFDITKDGNTCIYNINDAGYAGNGGGGMANGDMCKATTDAEVIAKWNAKTPVSSARTARTDTGYGLKSLGYSMYC